MSSHFCRACRSLFARGEDFGADLQHHNSLSELQNAAMEGCRICQTLIRSLINAKEIRSELHTRCSYSKILDEEGTLGSTPDTFSLYFTIPPTPDAINRRSNYGVRLTSLAEFWLIPTRTGVFQTQEQTLPELAANTGSNQTLNLAESWISRCRSKHEKCNQWLDDPPYYPSRLLDLGAGSASEIVTVISTDENTAITGSYITLSHRWGDQEFFRLLASTQVTLEEGVHLSCFPLTWVNAFTVARRLGVRYLWIDALCILQDSVQDWTKEAALMKSVYSNSFCNIAASGTPQNHEGCFFDRDIASLLPLYAGLRWPFGDPEPVQHLVISQDYWLRGVANAPLNRRAWVVQERLLSPRVLHFGEQQVYWECQELEACEAFPDGIPNLPGDRQTGITGFKDLDMDSGSLKYYECRPADETHEKFNAYQIWSKIVIAYSSSSLTVAADKLPALGGIAERMSILTQDQYLAGMWNRNIVDELCWSATITQDKDDTRILPRRSSLYRAPSWSWASMDHPITPGVYGYGAPLIEVIEARVELVSKNIFGAVKSGCLTLCGILNAFEIVGNLKEPAQGWSSRVNGTPLGTNIVEIMLDDTQDILPTELYCLPIKYYSHEAYGWDKWGNGPWIQGMILQPQGAAYCRVGAFFLPDNIEAIKSFKLPEEAFNYLYESPVDRPRHDVDTITII